MVVVASHRYEKVFDILELFGNAFKIICNYFFTNQNRTERCGARTLMKELYLLSLVLDFFDVCLCVFKKFVW